MIKVIIEPVSIPGELSVFGVKKTIKFFGLTIYTKTVIPIKNSSSTCEHEYFDRL